MTDFTGTDELTGATFTDADLSRARFVGCDLSGAVMRGVVVEGAEIEAPWLFEGGALHVNGVDVVPFVEAELDSRFPGRGDRQAADPDGLRNAWDSLQRTWAATLQRAAAMPAGSLDVSVDGEWSFTQTLRHLVLATDMWLGKGILELDQPFHPLGLSDGSMAEEGFDMSVFTTETPTYDDVLVARADRVALVRDYLASATAEDLAVEHRNPHDPAYPESTLNCLHVILDEEWEHHRYAVRDLDAIAAGPGTPS